MTGSKYTEDFFHALRDGALRSAGEMVPMVLDLIQPRSVIDVGCGTGTWLVTFAQHGVADYLGVDAFTPPELLEIPRERFLEADLTQPLVLDRDFDLVVSLETAEHLPEYAAKDFVASLARLAPVVLFSAAIPGQGGVSHVNEQWPDYWCRLFADYGFEAMDVFRPHFWGNERVDVWYVQNTILYVDQRRRGQFPQLSSAAEARRTPLSAVHPRLFAERDRILSVTAQAQAEAMARIDILNDALTAEREIVRSLAEENARLLGAAAEHQSWAQHCLAEVAEYRAAAAEARLQLETSWREVALGRVEIEAVLVEMNSYRFLAEPRNMSLPAYLGALPHVLSGALRRVAHRWR